MWNGYEILSLKKIHAYIHFWQQPDMLFTYNLVYLQHGYNNNLPTVVRTSLCIHKLCLLEWLKQNNKKNEGKE